MLGTGRLATRGSLLLAPARRWGGSVGRRGVGPAMVRRMRPRLEASLQGVVRGINASPRRRRWAGQAFGLYYRLARRSPGDCGRCDRPSRGAPHRRDPVDDAVGRRARARRPGATRRFARTGAWSRPTARAEALA